MSGAAITWLKLVLLYKLTMATCSWLMTSLVAGGALLCIRVDKVFELHLDELSAEHLRERRIGGNTRLLGTLDITGALN